MTYATTFRCGRFPEGKAHVRTALGEIVTFVDGVASVADQALAAALREVPPVFEISEDKPVPEERGGAAAVTPAAIRKWAKESGVDCPAKGKIPQAVADAYQTAHTDN